MARATSAMVWLVDLDVQGRIFRFASTSISLTSTTISPSPVLYVAGIVDLSISEDGCAVELDADPSTTGSWAELVSLGAVLSGSRVTVSTALETDTLEAAVVRAWGYVQEAEYGGVGEALTLSVALDWWRGASAMVPTPTQVVDSTTWPVSSGALLPEETMGAYYPIVIGQPSWSPAILCETPITRRMVGRSRMLPPSMSFVWTSARCVIAGHLVAATTVRVEDMTDGTDFTATVAATTDLRGQVVSGAGFTNAATGAAYQPTALDPSHEYWVTWLSDGGLLNDLGTAARTGAGDVIGWMLDQRGPRFSTDRGRCDAWRAYLDPLRLDCYINSPTTPDAWIQRNIGALLPLFRGSGQRGDYYGMWRYNAQPSEAVARLEVGVGGVARESRVKMLDREIINTITLNYGRSREGYASTLRSWSGADAYSSMIALESRRLYGERPLVIDSDVLTCPCGAQYAMTMLLAERAMPHSEVAISTPAALTSDLEKGSVVTLVDSTAGMPTERVCLVWDMVRARASNRLLLRVLNPILQAPRY